MYTLLSWWYSQEYKQTIQLKILKLLSFKKIILFTFFLFLHWRCQNNRLFHKNNVPRLPFHAFGVELCLFVCFFKAQAWLQEKLHCLQEKGFWLVCERMWTFRNMCTDYMQRALLQCVWECVTWDFELECRSRCTDYTGKASLLSGFACVS